MPKDTESLGNDKAPACESRGFVWLWKDFLQRLKGGVTGNYDTPSKCFIVVPSHDTYFVGVLIGVAPIVATSTERGCIKIAPQNMLLILKARPRLSQVRALLYHKDFVSL